MAEVAELYTLNNYPCDSCSSEYPHCGVEESGCDKLDEWTEGRKAQSYEPVADTIVRRPDGSINLEYYASHGGLRQFDDP